MRISLFAAVTAATVIAGPAFAQSNGHMGHAGATGHAAAGTTAEIRTAAVIHRVDSDKGMLNVTHEPIPELKWPEMTMDFHVTRRVDLSKVKAGDKVTLTLKQGVDKQYRVMDVTPAK